uniref:Motility protein n=1 Tax=Meloidogyne incognita TaxID=6306 RepID=A0A914N1W6_MELIC
MFMDLLKQSVAGTLQQGVQNLQQQQAMALLMNTINASGIGIKTGHAYIDVF